MTDPRILTQASQVTEHLLVLVASCVDDRYPPPVPMPTDEFVDRLCDDYLVAEGYDIEDLDTPAVRKIMKHARTIRREMA